MAHWLGRIRRVADVAAGAAAAVAVHQRRTRRRIQPQTPRRTPRRIPRLTQRLPPRLPPRLPQRHLRRESRHPHLRQHRQQLPSRPRRRRVAIGSAILTGTRTCKMRLVQQTQQLLRSIGKIMGKLRDVIALAPRRRRRRARKSYCAGQSAFERTRKKGSRGRSCARRTFVQGAVSVPA
jgi:hypothetical protein